jgi:DNA-directed RNA polymerase specialized sigma24 family protein
VPVGTIRSRLFYAIRAMRANLEADERPRVREAVG